MYKQSNNKSSNHGATRTHTGNHAGKTYHTHPAKPTNKPTKHFEHTGRTLEMNNANRSYMNEYYNGLYGH